MNGRSAIIAYYLLAVVALSGIGGLGLVVLEIFRPDYDRGLVVQLFGFLAPTLVALLALIRSEANAEAVKETKAAVEHNTQRQEQIIETVKSAMTESNLAGPKKPAAYRSRNELGDEP